MSAEQQAAARRVVILQLATTALLLLAALATPSMARSATATIGRTWPIAEPDAMAEIEAKTATLPPNLAAKFGQRSGWPALRAATLGVAHADRVRSLVPFHTLETDIRLPDGRILYPKGFTFNPLDYVRLAQRLVIVAPEDLGWALSAAMPADFILLTGSRTPGRQPDILTLSDRVHRPLFILEERVKARLGLTVAPVVVVQSGQKLVLTEIGPEHRRTVAPGARP